MQITDHVMNGAMIADCRNLTNLSIEGCTVGVKVAP
jgi:hypothetical protein